MKYHDLRDFIAQLERMGELKRVSAEIDPRFEMTEICDRVLRAGGPAILFEKPKGSAIPVLANLFGTPRRVALGMGEESVQALREVGKRVDCQLLLDFLDLHATEMPRVALRYSIEHLPEVQRQYYLKIK